MKSILSIYRKKSTILKIDCLKLIVIWTILIVLVSCSRSTSTRPVADYATFVSSLNKQADPIAEIYGQYSAEQSDRKIRAKFNLLLDPGKSAYIEILDPSDRLINILTVSQEVVSLLWVKDNVYIQEEASPATLRAVTGLPVHPDDALQLISGQGLQFAAWQQVENLNDGWKLEREGSSAEIKLQQHLSKIEATTAQGRFLTYYDKYASLSDKLLPTRIRFELPERRTNLELRINKYVPRTEAVTANLFEIKIPSDARRLTLNEIYRGRPLLME